ncbi:MAG TPA: 16S rRNA (adenine(1518)-N(6)/adenine(1519)-N(6))-dimethyltransferase RsmA [Acidobacteriaceae bacterium]|nr:16S rRNA (adenine(1518)-N(6)/adenine(1519)-N(6))-dimethyltransferase RsmA [Acidobacteriaceae bacterium]
MAQSSAGRRPQKPRLGQNFLVSPTAPRAIVDALGELGGATVLEIGPGRGAITRLLAERSRHLIAVELDRELAESLKRELAGGGQAKVEVLREDILRTNLTALSAQAGVRLHVVGNLPYYITSDILLHLFAHHAAIEKAVLMVQREVADRIVADPGSRDYGLLSATTQMYARAERLFTLPPGAFSPPPQVHSTVFRLTIQPRFAELAAGETAFLRFLRQVFAQKRKTLANNLRAAGYDAAGVQAALEKCGIAPAIRAEACSLETMACLFRALEERSAAASR